MVVPPPFSSLFTTVAGWVSHQDFDLRFLEEGTVIRIWVQDDLEEPLVVRTINEPDFATLDLNGFLKAELVVNSLRGFKVKSRLLLLVGSADESVSSLNEFPLDDLGFLSIGKTLVFFVVVPCSDPGCEHLLEDDPEEVCVSTTLYATTEKITRIEVFAEPVLTN